jgi:hypothetical protein
LEPFRQAGSEPKAALLHLEDWLGQFGISAGFSTRHAGNVALHVGDDADAVCNRRRNVAAALGWPFEAWTCGEQVHGHHVHAVSSDEAGRGRLERETAFADTDALITNEPGILLVQFFADCVPLYFYDPKTGALGLAHAGWKGTVADIAGQTVRALSERYGVDASGLRAAIGPSIGPCCYEVDEVVLSQVRLTTGTEHAIRPTGPGKAMLDLKELNRHFMIKAGILPSHIEMTSWCTGCRTDLFFSHRKERGSTGRMMSWIGKRGEVS